MRSNEMKTDKRELEADTDLRHFRDSRLGRELDRRGFGDRLKSESARRIQTGGQDAIIEAKTPFSALVETNRNTN